MAETNTRTTLNGRYEITKPADIPTAEQFREHLASEYGLNGQSPRERVERLKDLSVEGIAILLEDINKTVQGSEESLMSHDKSVNIVGPDGAVHQELLAPENRYDVFRRMVEDIKSSPDDINPTRVGDVLALGTVLLHPFHDGNGRTARVIGMLFREDYDDKDFSQTYDAVIEPRDVARARGGYIIYGYTPRLPEGFDYTNPEAVSAYLHRQLTDDEDGSYIGCFGPAPLH